MSIRRAARLARAAQIRVVKKVSVPHLHYSALHNVTLCGWPLRNKEPNYSVVEGDADCAACVAVVDIICEEFE